MENRSSSSSSEDSQGYSSTNVNLQKMDISETSSSKSSEENLGVRVADKQKASSPGSSQVDHELKSFDRHSKEEPIDCGSSENAHPDQKSQFSTDKPVRNDEMSKKLDKNLEKFFKEREPLKEVQLRKKTNTSTRLVKSEGEMAYILEYCANMLKDSTLSNTQRSSAPPTFNSQRFVAQKPQTEILSAVEYSNKELNSKGIAQTSDTLKRDADGTENTSSKALDLRLKTISTFKVPISPDTKTTSDKSPKILPTDSKKDVASPVQRPTHFNANPRKAFYTFSPGSPSGLLRQCQSLPNINRPRRKDEGQRRSINLEEQSRIVRSLFRDKPEPATPESRVSTFYNRCLDAPESMEKSPEGEVPKPLQNIPSKTCRRLVFGSCSKETAEKNQNVVVKKVSCVAKAAKNNSSGNVPQEEVSKYESRPSKSCRKLDFGSNSKETTSKNQQNGVSCDAESPSKRKNESPAEIRCSISLKKVRLSSELKVEENINSENVRKIKSPVDDKCPISAKEVKTSSGTKIEDDRREKNVSVFDSECSTSTKNVETSSIVKMEGVGSGENVRKTCQIDSECSSSAKKVKTASEIIVQSGRGENIKKHSIPIDVSSICAKKVRTSSETKSDESESD